MREMITNGLNCEGAVDAEPVSVLIVQADSLLRELLQAQVSCLEGVHVVGSSGSGSETLELVARHRPAVILLDTRLSDMDGFGLLEKLHRTSHPPLALMLTGDESEDTEVQAARVGAAGFVRKSQAAMSLGSAIRGVASGENWFSRPALARILSEYTQVTRRLEESARDNNPLSPRELEVLRCIGQGKSNKQIASELFMSLPTVKAHLRNTYRKLNLSSRWEASLYAVRQNLVSQ